MHYGQLRFSFTLYRYKASINFATHLSLQIIG